MYRAIVRRIVRHAFDDLSHNRFEHHRRRFAQDAVMRVHMEGRTEVFTGDDQLREAFEMLGSSKMEGPFEIMDIWVKGWPWDARVAVAWTRRRHADDRGGVVYGVNRIRLGRGGVIEEDVFIA